MGDVINKYTPAGIIGGALGVNVGDQLMGGPGTPAQQLNMNSAAGQAASNAALGQTQGMMGKYQDLMNQDTSQLAANQTQQEMNQARQNSQDSSMRAQQEVAKRGLGGSSLGLSAILGGQQQLGNQLGSIQANEPMLARQMQMQNYQAAGTGMAQANGGISGLLNAQNSGNIYQKQGAPTTGLLGSMMPAMGQGLGNAAGAAMLA